MAVDPSPLAGGKFLRRTGAPAPPPVWQLVCEFANGSCVCVRTGKGPCEAVRVVATRIEDRAFHDLGQAYHLRRRATDK